MKSFTKILWVLSLIAGFYSCTSDSDDPLPVGESNPLEEFNLVTSINANGHALEVYGENKELKIGYNELYLRVKDMEEGTYFENPAISWMPMMHMMDREHSCPKSTLKASDDKTVLKGYVVFQMPSNSDEYWDITFNYTVDGQEYTITEEVEVNSPADGMKTISVFMGADESKYVLTMMPMKPEVKVNDFSAMLFKMESMMDFSLVENYTVAIDPRMPGMGNHSSPNNEHLKYNASSQLYTGKLSLTMTGYWKINLKLLNASDEVLKGEDITDENESSSIFFELEF